MKNKIFFWKKKSKEEIAKEAVLKVFFNEANQRRAIEKAARESAMDQNIMYEKYKKLMKA